MRVLNFGSLNIDYVYNVDHIVKKGETISSDTLNVFCGGKGLNQSIALSKAGAEVYHAGVIGEDGAFLEEILRASGVHTRFVQMKADTRTGNAIIQKDRNGDNCILLYGGSNRAVTPGMADEVLEHFEAGDMLVLQNEISELSYLMERAHERGMVIALNPSPIDEELLKAPLQYVNYFILNEIEAKTLTNGVEEDNAMLEAMLKKFPNAEIILTLGERGSVYAKGTVRVEQGIYKVPVTDTTAAGDTFTGYYLASIIQGLSVEKALNMAAKASAIAVSRKGAAPSIPEREEVENMKLSVETDI
ncbi:MAG: ribokinase [Hungatella hathewayi]|uniref:ribokinase n=1 Tax=Hungatella TaxID=1649459 RepID=UPI001106B505|nr:MULTISPECIES: ribokinase [Hungatella]MCI7382359.1 ribokinase [Hungatella sp.]MDY6239542.1 ribokinase [Hungatella hathewayi]